MRTRSSFKWFVLVVALVLVATVSMSFKRKDREGEPEMAAEAVKEDVSQEEYVDVIALSGEPMFVQNDFVGLELFSKEYGVITTVVGPAQWDIDAMVKSLDEVIARKPAGIIVHGFSPALKGGIDRAIDAGIPVVCVDADVPDSKRLSFIGTDWYNVGVVHAERLAKLIGGKGKVAGFLVIGIDIYEYTAQGYRDELSKYPDIELLGIYNDEANDDVAFRLTTDMVIANPDLAGISVFDGKTPSVAAAIRELGMGGKIKVTGMNVDPPMIKALEDGLIQVLVGQKRKLFTYYGAKFLYDYNHSPVTITPNDRGAGITNLPPRVDTGIFLVTPENVKAFKGEE